MKKFRFRLEVVLKERKRIEENKLRDWSISRNMLEKLYDEKKAMEDRLQAAMNETTDTGRVGSTAMFDTMEKFISGTKIRIDWKSQQVARAEKFVEKKRLEYVDASRKRQALEKLKERRYHEYLEKKKKTEHRFLDDLYVMRAQVQRIEEEDVA